MAQIATGLEDGGKIESKTHKLKCLKLLLRKNYRRALVTERKFSNISNKTLCYDVCTRSYLLEPVTAWRHEAQERVWSIANSDRHITNIKFFLPSRLDDISSQK